MLSSEAASPDSKLLKFALPSHMDTLGAPLPSCLKVKETLPGMDGKAVV